MAVLNDADRLWCRQRFSQQISVDEEPCAASKAEVAAALAAIDDFIDSNMAIILTRVRAVTTNLTGRQIARLLAAVLARRLDRT